MSSRCPYPWISPLLLYKKGQPGGSLHWLCSLYHNVYRLPCVIGSRHPCFSNGTAKGPCRLPISETNRDLFSHLICRKNGRKLISGHCSRTFRPQPCQYLNGGSGAVQIFFCDERFFSSILFRISRCGCKKRVFRPEASRIGVFLLLAGLFCLSIAGRDVPHHPQFFQHRNPFRVQAAPSVLHPRLVDQTCPEAFPPEHMPGAPADPRGPVGRPSAARPLPKPFLVEVGTEPRFLQTASRSGESFPASAGHAAAGATSPAAPRPGWNG